MVRIWHGEQWIRRLLKCFCPKEISAAMPALWAADDPGVLVGGETMTGNQNLVQFVDDGYWGVIARNSAFTYKGRSVDVRQVAR
jgi:hypothetical protein